MNVLILQSCVYIFWVSFGAVKILRFQIFRMVRIWQVGSRFGIFGIFFVKNKKMVNTF